jgi:hypothetical protein
MKRVIILIPVWRRLMITEFCYRNLQKSIEDASSEGIELVPFIIATEDDHKDLADSFGFQWLYSPNDYVSDKLNRGLEAVLPFRSDYITLLGSDNRLLPMIWKEVKKEIDAQTPFFGWSEVKFINVETGDSINAEYPCTTGVARFHRTDILREIARRYLVHVMMSHVDGDRSYNENDIELVSNVNGYMHLIENKIGIWTPGMMTGMDMDAEAYINSHGYTIKHMQGQFIYDYKTEENLTSWDEVTKNLQVLNYAKDNKE